MMHFAKSLCEYGAVFMLSGGIFKGVIITNLGQDSN